MPDPLIEIRNLTVSFAVGGVLLPAVKELTLTLQPNEVVGLVGESGSGKSTALLAVMNYLPGNAVVETGSIVHGGIGPAPRRIGPPSTGSAAAASP